MGVEQNSSSSSSISSPEDAEDHHPLNLKPVYLGKVPSYLSEDILYRSDLSSSKDEFPCTPSSTMSSCEQTATNQSMGKASGQKRVKRHFIPDSKTRSKLQPNREVIFRRVWSWSLSFSGIRRSDQMSNEPDSQLRQLGRELEHEDDTVQSIQGMADMHILQIRWRSVLVAAELERRIANLATDLDQQGQGRRQTKDQNDTHIEMMARDLFGLEPTYSFHSQDPKRKMAKRWIQAGQLLLMLTREMGLASLLIPGILVSQEDLAKVKSSEAREFVDYIKQLYTDWRQEVLDVTPLLEFMMCRDLAHGPLLNIQLLSTGSMPTNMNCSFTYWLSPVQHSTASELQPLLALENGFSTQESLSRPRGTSDDYEYCDEETEFGVSQYDTDDVGVW